MKRILIPKYIEISKGAIFGGTYPRISISLTLQPNLISIKYKVKPYIQNPSLDGHQEEFLTLENYIAWYNKLKKTYGKRITRKNLYYTTQCNGIFEYTNYAARTTKRACESNNLEILTNPTTL